MAAMAAMARRLPTGRQAGFFLPSIPASPAMNEKFRSYKSV